MVCSPESAALLAKMAGSYMDLFVQSSVQIANCTIYDVRNSQGFPKADHSLSMASTAVKLKRCGIRFEPPAVIVTYSLGSKIHRRTMPLRQFTKKTGITRTARELKENPRHKKYLAQVPLPQLEKLVTIIQDKMNGLSLEASLEKNKKLSVIDPEEDLNKVDEETLKRKKALMEQSFERNKKKPGDPDFEYDVEVDFEGGAIETCEWDSDNGDDDEF